HVDGVELESAGVFDEAGQRRGVQPSRARPLEVLALEEQRRHGAKREARRTHRGAFAVSAGAGCWSPRYGVDCGSVATQARERDASSRSASSRPAPSSGNGWNGASGQRVIWIGVTSASMTPSREIRSRAMPESLSLGSLLPPNTKFPSE